ncbi:MAG: type II toxin-antitoxin system VapC family toxin [Deltaproteobacteria bacterium]|nr:type II toxin-antitoxin system VapC family toxin [Deltaproteobacteria bacterium]
MIYFDTSALAKNYVWEDGSSVVARLLLENPDNTTSKLTYAEILSAMARRMRNGDLSKSKMKEVVEKFEDDWKGLLIVDLHDDLLPIAKRVIERHQLRAADSIHLASAVWLKTTLKENVTFISADLNLLKAAKVERLSPINPQEH